MCFKDNNLINDIPFMLFMQEQEQKEKEAETALRDFRARQQVSNDLAKEDTNRRDRFQSADTQKNHLEPF